MEIKKLRPASLMDVLEEMKVGETAIAPADYKPKTVQVACAQLRDRKGYLFQTSTKTGVQTVTRLR